MEETDIIKTKKIELNLDTEGIFLESARKGLEEGDLIKTIESCSVIIFYNITKDKAVNPEAKRYYQLAYKKLKEKQAKDIIDVESYISLIKSKFCDPNNINAIYNSKN
jgi:hypothetical protein